MHWIDYLIEAVPLPAVIGIGCRGRKYVGNATDFMTTGRYVIAVAGGGAAMEEKQTGDQSRGDNRVARGSNDVTFNPIFEEKQR